MEEISNPIYAIRKWIVLYDVDKDIVYLIDDNWIRFQRYNKSVPSPISSLLPSTTISNDEFKGIND